MTPSFPPRRSLGSLRSERARITIILTAQFKRLLMKQVDQFMARKRQAEHRSVSDTCWLAVERANYAEHRATRRTVNPSAGSMIEQRGNTPRSEKCVLKGLSPLKIVGATRYITQHIFPFFWPALTRRRVTTGF